MNNSTALLLLIFSMFLFSYIKAECLWEEDDFDGNAKCLWEDGRQVFSLSQALGLGR
jgi:hypothetical protein